MNNLKQKKVIALRKVGVDRKTAEVFRRSANDYLLTYTGRNPELITTELKGKLITLFEERRKQGVEVAGIFFKDNFEVTFIFYVDDNPEDAWFERSPFSSYEEFEKELERQLDPLFIPDMSVNKHVIAPEGMQANIVWFH